MDNDSFPGSRSLDPLECKMFAICIATHPNCTAVGGPLSSFRNRVRDKRRTAPDKCLATIDIARWGVLCNAVRRNENRAPGDSLCEPNVFLL